MPFLGTLVIGIDAGLLGSLVVCVLLVINHASLAHATLQVTLQHALQHCNTATLQYCNIQILQHTMQHCNRHCNTATLHTHKNTHTHTTHAHTHARSHARTHTRTHAQIHTRTHAHMAHNICIWHTWCTYATVQVAPAGKASEDEYVERYIFASPQNAPPGAPPPPAPPTVHDAAL